jgi:dihydrofolate synthase / folylpolyglutamate synthase
MARSPDILDHDSALAYLFGRIDYERADRFPSRSRGLSLDRMRELAFRLGDPQRHFPVVHVAGTKGKGSTSGMIAAVLTASGYRTGLYTSPHVVCIEERMQIDGRRCGADEFVDLIRRIRPVVDALDGEYEARGEGKPGPTYFEITTAAALLHFARQQVDVAVLEVGLGGRLDSTNICQPEVAVITSISFDHMRQLGNTLALIAGEKAGIIKPGVPVVTGVTEPESLDVIRQTALRHHCECYRAGQHFDHRYGGTHPPTWESSPPAVWPHGWSEFDYWEDNAGGRYELQGLRTGLLGRHQAANAAVAVATLVRLRERGWRAEEAAIREGLSRVDMPARTEVLRCRPMVILDAAHNVASARALIDVIRETCPRTGTGQRILVFAASQDKDVAAMLRLLLAEFDVAILTRFLNNPRAADPDVLIQTAEQIAVEQGAACSGAESCRLITRDNSTDAWDLARSLAGGDDVICVAGSFFLASELRSLIPQEAQNP